MLCLRRNFGNQGNQGIQAILSASDEDLLCGRNFGQKMLAEFRAVWPEPLDDVATDDPWRDHAEMVAGVR